MQPDRRRKRRHRSQKIHLKSTDLKNEFVVRMESSPNQSNQYNSFDSPSQAWNQLNPNQGGQLGLKSSSSSSYNQHRLMGRVIMGVMQYNQEMDPMPGDRKCKSIPDSILLSRNAFHDIIPHRHADDNGITRITRSPPLKEDLSPSSSSADESGDEKDRTFEDDVCGNDLRIYESMGSKDEIECPDRIQSYPHHSDAAAAAVFLTLPSPTNHLKPQQQQLVRVVLGEDKSAATGAGVSVTHNDPQSGNRISPSLVTKETESAAGTASASCPTCWIWESDSSPSSHSPSAMHRLPGGRSSPLTFRLTEEEADAAAAAGNDQQAKWVKEKGKEEEMRSRFQALQGTGMAGMPGENEEEEAEEGEWMAMAEKRASDRRSQGGEKKAEEGTRDAGFAFQRSKESSGCACIPRSGAGGDPVVVVARKRASRKADKVSGMGLERESAQIRGTKADCRREGEGEEGHGREMGRVGADRREETHEVQEKAILILLSDPADAADDEEEDDEEAGSKGQSWEQKESKDADKWYERVQPSGRAGDDSTGVCLPAVSGARNHQQQQGLLTQHTVRSCIPILVPIDFHAIPFFCPPFPLPFLLSLSIRQVLHSFAPVPVHFSLTHLLTPLSLSFSPSVSLHSSSLFLF